MGNGSHLTFWGCREHQRDKGVKDLNKMDNQTGGVKSLKSSELNLNHNFNLNNLFV